MSPERNRTSAGGRGKLDDHRVSKMLKLAKSGGETRRPIDHLVDRIGEPDGNAWLESILMSAGADPTGRTLFEGAHLDRLRSIKDRGKLSFLCENERDLRLGGLLTYFAAVASALAHHRRLITRRGSPDVKAVLLELARVAPPPWCDLFRRGGETVPEAGGSSISGKSRREPPRP